MGARLTREQWQRLECEYRTGTSAKRLASHFGIAPQTIHAKASREKWRAELLDSGEPSNIERLENIATRLESVVRSLARRKK